MFGTHAFAAAAVAVGVATATPVTPQGVTASNGLSVAPFGSIREHLEQKSPWFGYLSVDGYGFSVLAQKVSSQCPLWSKALVSAEMAVDHGGVPVTLALPPAPKASNPEGAPSIASDAWKDQWFKAWQAFEPWSKDEVNMIRHCDGSPCRVKISRDEGKRMDEAGEEGRVALFRDLVGDRVGHYLKTEERLETEVPGKPIEPWSFMEQKGLISSLKRPEKPSFWARQFREQKDDEVKIRQIVDRRTAIKADASEAALWIRDIYSDHFFDSWGEFLHVSCNRDGSGVLVQALFLEVDLLKKNDLLTRIARGKIRASLEDRARAYQEQELKAWLTIVHDAREKGEKKPTAR